MKFLYLIQGKAVNVRRYGFLNSNHSRLLGLSYDAPEPGFEYFPKSSFASGRNFLLDRARQQLDDFDYFVFLDDDVEFCRGSFELMERNLERTRPPVGVPLTEKTRRTALGVELAGRIRPLLQHQRLHINDEQYLACSREVIVDGRLLPYLTDWDSQSWFVCCLIQEALIQHHYFGRALQFNNCEIRNDQHSDAYPHNLDFARKTYLEWMQKHFPKGSKRPALYETTVCLDGGFQKLCRSLLTATAALVKRSAAYRRIRGIRPW